MNLLMIFIIGLHALDWSNRFKTEKYCAGKSFDVIESIQSLKSRLVRRRGRRPSPEARFKAGDLLLDVKLRKIIKKTKKHTIVSTVSSY